MRVPAAIGRAGLSLWRGTLLLVAALVSCQLAAQGGEREALLMPGKESLYQRILTRPGALVLGRPGEPDERRLAPPPLSLFFVFERRLVGGQEWIEIGLSAKGEAQGWVPADKAIDWKQTLTVAFTRTSDRGSALFFRDRGALSHLIASERMIGEVTELRVRIREGSIPEGFPVISVEPSVYVDPNKSFYLLPILGFEEASLESGHSIRLLNVAAVTLRAGEQDLLAQDPQRGGQGPGGDQLKGYRAGVVFVIDSTSSMGPYIERTRRAVRQIYRKLRDSPYGSNLSFGLVAYRDSVEAVPGLEYVSRIVATLDDGREEMAFFRNVDRVVPAAMPSKGFNEDAYAGVYDAIQGVDWSDYDGRFLILISDAGPRLAEDPLSRTKLGAERLRLMAQEKDQGGGGKIAISVLHLLTPEGRQTHLEAAQQYRALSQWGEAGSLYFPVADGAVAAFGDQVDALADSLLQQLASAHAGRLVEVPEDLGASELERKTALVGRAMQLAYLGRVGGSEAPRLIDAWVADRDFVNPSAKTLEVRLLITKNQLSDLQETLEAILAAGERTFMSEKDFFAQLRSAAATLARDPSKVNQIQVRRLADVGLVGEWLSDLPYLSQVMNITEPRWLKRTYAEQQEVLDTIEEKILLYREIHDDADRWISLDEALPLGEAVTTIPLDALP